MKIINDEQLNESIKSGDKTLVLFSADWCGPCKIIKPAVEKIEKELEHFISYQINLMYRYQQVIIETEIGKSISKMKLKEREKKL